jgi:N,N'-diacetyllegionaminate synthase
MLNKIFKREPIIIAEIGVNHNSHMYLAKRLVKVALEAGADAIKLQTFKAYECASKFAEAAEYQKNAAQNQLELLQWLELSYPDTADLKEYAESFGLVFISTPDGQESLDFICDIGTKIIKVASGELTNLPFLYQIGSKGRPVILSTGMGTMEEVEAAVNALKDAGAPEIAVTHCTTAYPAPAEEANLKAICTLKERLGLQVGYSDHTLGCEASVAALALGATIFEKHITIDKNLSGPDHHASMEPEEFTAYVKALRTTAKMLGDGIKAPTPSELKNMPFVRRSLVAKTDLKAGHELSGLDIAIKRPATGIAPQELHSIFGRKLKCDLQEDEPIKWEHLE